MAIPTMPGPAMARCSRRGRRWRSCGPLWRRLRRPAQAVAYGEEIRSARSPSLHAGRPRARLGADRGRSKGLPIVASGDYKRRRRSDLRAVRAGALRRVHHRGHLRPAGVPPSADRRTRSHKLLALGRAVPGARPSGRRLCARQGAARDRAAARGRLRRADLRPRRDGATHALYQSRGVDLGPLAPARGRARPTSPARS